VAIAGDRPETGLRLTLDRASEAPLVYEGVISTKDADFTAKACVDDSGNVEVITDGGADLAEKARLIVRTVLRHAATDGVPPPRRIQRWRAS
jgi:hypothetical protein